MSSIKRNLAAAASGFQIIGREARTKGEGGQRGGDKKGEGARGSFSWQATVFLSPCVNEQ